MKHFYLFFVLVLGSLTIHAQQTIEASLMHDGLEREYLIYVPSSYAGFYPRPLVFNFHGLGSNATEQMNYGDFRSIADEANFILVIPQGTEIMGTTHWNVGGFTAGSSANDVGFTEAMIDSVSANYNIDPDRIYSTGMSNGGYMSFHLACRLSNKIAAVASVTGSMTPGTFDDCEPSHPTPVLQIHGDMDNVVPYNGTAWSKAISEVIEYWVDYNGCQTELMSQAYDNTNTADNSTAEHRYFVDCESTVTVEHIKITGGGHTWPGSFPFPGTNMDINASQIIWDFFDRYDINGLREVSSTEDHEGQSVNVFPNPTSGMISVEAAAPFDYELLDVNGNSISEVSESSDNQKTVDLSTVLSGVYLIRIGEKMHRIIKI